MRGLPLHRFARFREPFSPAIDSEAQRRAIISWVKNCIAVLCIFTLAGTFSGRAAKCILISVRETE
jgi:hypothetical protein